jgi:glucokinase
MIVKANGPKCNCGNSGCLEAISSRTAITKKIRKAVLKQGRKSHILELNDGNLDNIRSKTLAKAVASGDKVTIKVIRRTAKYLGIGIASVVNFLNPEMIILGGGVVEALDDEFIKRIRKFAKAYALPNTMDGIEIVTAKLGDDAGVIGASVLARQNLGTTY